MALKYSSTDKEVFIRILGKYTIIEDKRTDTYNIERKKKAWEQIVIEYNNSVTEKRTVIQLKRLWDKMKRGRKNALAEERREMMATGGGPPKPSPTPMPDIDNILPHLEFEVPIEDDSDGLILNKNARVITQKIDQKMQLEHTVIDPTTVEEIRPSSTLEVSNQTEGILETPRSHTRPMKKTNLDKITEARLLLIKTEQEQLVELHKERMEEAKYRTECARLAVLQEQEKLKKLLKE